MNRFYKVVFLLSIILFLNGCCPCCMTEHKENQKSHEDETTNIEPENESGN